MAKHKRSKKAHKRGMAEHVANFKKAKKGHKKHGGKKHRK